jgi:hypothetical protein
MPSPACYLDNCSSNHRGADCRLSCCDTAVGSYSDDTSDRVSVHANINSVNADPVPHVCVSVNDHDAGDYSPAVARRMAAAILEAADLAEAGALRHPAA